MPLPSTGDLNWGDALNDYVTNVVQATAQSALTGLNNHTTAVDPHGDRAYTDTATAAITSLKGAVNGYAELGADGKLKALQAPAGGGRTNAYDVIKDYGAVGDGVADDTTAIQNALNACAAAGGGEVWIPNGTFLASNLEIKSPGNLWLHLSNGATIKRKASSTAQNFITNFNSTTDRFAYAGVGQLIISGGTIDGNTANNSTSCTLLSLAHASGVVIRDMIFQNITDWNAINLCACTNVVVEASGFRGLNIVTSGNYTSPAIKISAAINSSALPGMSVASYDNTACFGVSISKCMGANLGTYGSFGSLVASVDDTSSTTLIHSNIRVADNTMLKANRHGVRAIGWLNSTIARNVFKDCNGMVSVEIPASRPVGSNIDGDILIDGNIGNNVGVINNGVSVLSSAIAAVGKLSAGASPPSETYSGIHITNNQVVNWANQYAVYLLNCRESQASNNSIVNGTASPSYGVMVLNSFYTRVTNNRIKQTASSGVFLGVLDTANPGSGCAHSSVCDNIVSDCGASGISVNYSGYINAFGNNLQNTIGAGIRLNNGVSNTLVNNNVGQNTGTNGTQMNDSGGTNGNQIGGAVIG